MLANFAARFTAYLILAKYPRRKLRPLNPVLCRHCNRIVGRKPIAEATNERDGIAKPYLIYGHIRIS